MNFADYMWELPREKNYGAKLLIDYVEEGMSPFRIRSGDVYDEYDIEFHIHWVIAEVRLSNGDRIAHKEPIDDNAFLADPAKEVLRIAELMLIAFRQRKGELVNDRIVLGEN